MQKVIIVGGTGFIGAKLVRALCARGDDVCVLSRQTSPPIAKERVIRWDPRDDSGEWTREIDGSDAIVNLAGASVADDAWTPERLALLTSSRTGTSKAVCDAIAIAKKKPRVLVNGSAVGYYGAHATGEETFDESSPASDDVLGAMCVAWEAAAIAARDSGVRVALARIGIVLGDAGALAKMMPPFKAFVGGPIGSGKQVLSWVHEVDCVRALIFAIDRESMDGPFNICAPNPATMDEFATALGKAMDRPSAFRVPAFVVRTMMGADRASIVLEGQRVLPKRLTSEGFAFNHSLLLPALSQVVRGVS